MAQRSDEPPTAPDRREKSAEHRGTLYFAPDGVFSERQKYETMFPPRTLSRLEFHDVSGRIRFDPDVKPGRFRIRTTTLRDTQDRTLLSAQGKELRHLWRVEGTARLVAWDDDGLLIESTGIDPSLVLCVPDHPVDEKRRITIDLESL